MNVNISTPNKLLIFKKTLLVHDLLDEIQSREEDFDKEDIIIYKEDKKKYWLEPLKLKDPLDDESADAGSVYVIEFKGSDFNQYSTFLNLFNIE